MTVLFPFEGSILETLPPDSVSHIKSSGPYKTSHGVDSER